MRLRILQTSFAVAFLLGATVLVAQEKIMQQEPPSAPTDGTVRTPSPANEVLPTSAANPQAFVPRFIKFSGTLGDMASKPIVGATDVTFALYTEEAGGTPLWYETQTIEADALGRYTVLLGAMHANGVPVELFTSGEARWLGVQVGNLPETAQGGRVLLVSVPYALKTLDAETLGGKPASAYMLAPTESGQEPGGTRNPATPGAPSTTLVGKGGKTQPKPLTSTPATTFADTTTNQVVLVTQNGTGMGLLATAPSNTALEGVTSGTGTTTFAGVYGLSNGATGAGKGVIGQSNSTTGVGVYALETATTGLSYGLLATAKSTSGVGIQGQATATTGNTIGLFGLNFSTSGIGLSGQNNAASGATIGVQAKVFSASGTAMVVDNTAGGKIASLRHNGTEMASVDGVGNITTLGSISLPTTSGSGAGLIALGGTSFAHNCCGGTGSLNTFVGFEAGNLTSTGTNNTGLGAQALTNILDGNISTAIGNFALLQDGHGGANTAVGANALISTNDGSGNTAMGAGAGTTNQTGNFNTLLGYNTNVSIANLSNATVIGANAVVGESNALVLGATGSRAVNVGIGTATPAATLDVETAAPTSVSSGNGTNGHDGLVVNAQAGGASSDPVGTGGKGGSITLTAGKGGDIVPGMGAAGGSGGSITLTAGNSSPTGGGSAGNISLQPGGGPGPGNTIIDAQKVGKVGIRTSSPTNIFTIAQTSGHAIADGWDTYSSQRFKTKIRTLPNALGTLEHLRGVAYNDKATGHAEIGVIAEEVETVLPQVVDYGPDGEVNGVDYARLTALLIQATKEQQAQIRKLKAQVRQLKQRQVALTSLEARLDRLEARERGTQTTSGRQATEHKKPARAEVARLGR